MSRSALSALTPKPFTGVPDGYTPAAPNVPEPKRRPRGSVVPSGTVRDWRYNCPCSRSDLVGRTTNHGKIGTLSNSRARIEVYAAMASHRAAWVHTAWAKDNQEDARRELTRWEGWSDVLS